MVFSLYGYIIFWFGVFKNDIMVLWLSHKLYGYIIFKHIKWYNGIMLWPHDPLTRMGITVKLPGILKFREKSDRYIYYITSLS